MASLSLRTQIERMRDSARSDAAALPECEHAQATYWQGCADAYDEVLGLVTPPDDEIDDDGVGREQLVLERDYLATLVVRAADAAIGVITSAHVHDDGEVKFRQAAVDEWLALFPDDEPEQGT